MTLSTLDRSQLEAIVLGENSVSASGRSRSRSHSRDCGEQTVPSCLRDGSDPRETRLRHVLAAAHELLVRITTEAFVGRSVVDSPELVERYLRVHFAGAERETFVVIFLDTRYCVISVEELFRGTLTQTSVHSREVVRRALLLNAGAVICAHPHPSSGDCEPSRADELITAVLRQALSLVDVHLLDHWIVGGATCVSLARRGLL